MTSVGEISLIAKIDTSQYKKGTSDIEKANDDLEKSTDKTSKKVGSSFSAAAQVATGAILAAGALIAKTFVQSASEIQSLRASFESLTGNVEDTNSVMSDLYELGKQTAFSNKDIQAAGRNYLAAGVSVEGLNQVLKDTADIAGATGADLGQLTLPLTQTIARGKLQTQDFYQILNSGAGALRKPLTELAGKKGFGSLAEALEESAITSEDLLKVMGDVTKEGGFAFQGAIKQSQTFNGRMSNLQEAITNVGLSILGVDAITGKVDPSGVFSKLSQAVSATTEFLVKYGEVVKQVGAVIGIFLIPAILALGKSGLLAGRQLAKGILLALGPVGLTVAAITAAAFLIYKNWDKISKFFGNIWDGISKGAMAAWSQITVIFQDAWNSVMATFGTIGEFFYGIWEGVKAIFTSVLDWIREWGLTVLAVIFFPISLIVGLFFKFKNEILGFFTAIYNGIVGIITPIVGVMTAIFTAIYNSLVAILTPVVSFFGTVFQQSWDAITVIFGVLGSWFSARWNEVMQVFSGVASFFSSVFQAAWNAITSIFGSIGRWFLVNVWNPIISLFSGVGSSVGNAIGAAFKGVINNVLRFASNTINGFIDAINSAIGVINNIPGVKISNIGKLPVPQLAEGGIVSSPTLAMIGEGKESEAVIPLSKLDSMLNGDTNNSNVTVNLTLSGVMTSSRADERAVANRIGKLLNETLTAKGAKVIEGL